MFYVTKIGKPNTHMITPALGYNPLAFIRVADVVRAHCHTMRIMSFRQMPLLGSI